LGLRHPFSSTIRQYRIPTWPDEAKSLQLFTLKLYGLQVAVAGPFPRGSLVPKLALREKSARPAAQKPDNMQRGFRDTPLTRLRTPLIAPIREKSEGGK
jgi:hypothetical protein